MGGILLCSDGPQGSEGAQPPGTEAKGSKGQVPWTEGGSEGHCRWVGEASPGAERQRRAS